MKVLTRAQVMRFPLLLVVVLWNSGKAFLTPSVRPSTPLGRNIASFSVAPEQAASEVKKDTPVIDEADVVVIGSGVAG